MKTALRALALMLMACPAAAQSPQVLAAIEAGQVGERYDGYLGFAIPPSDNLRRQVIAINIRRRNLYTELAVQRNVNVQLVGITTACTLIRRVPIGGAYMLEDKIWRRRAAGEAEIVPNNCR
ncbi:MAG TPA: YdbL family protein [Sphingomicrobium sp.]|nr:YdbL family protein [Sphingomicrobium sp.]